MLWLGIIIGIVVGAGGYYLYDKFFGSKQAYKELTDVINQQGAKKP